MLRNYKSINESKIVAPYTKDAPIVLKSLDCKAFYNDENYTITIEVPNGNQFVCANNTFKWVEGYPKSIALSHKRCETALNNLKNDNLIEAMQEIYKLPYAPYFVYLFEKDKSMLKNFTYILDKVEDEKKESVELFLKSIIEGKEEVNKLKKSEIQNYNFIKENLENIVLYLKCKCEVFYWFYQGLPQLTQFGIW
jgi:hypothetical protein